MNPKLEMPVPGICIKAEDFLLACPFAFLAIPPIRSCYPTHSNAALARISRWVPPGPPSGNAPGRQ